MPYKNKAEKAKQDKSYYERNREKIRAYQARYYQENREKLRARSRAYSREHSEERAKYAREWRKRNPEKVKRLHERSWERTKRKKLVCFVHYGGDPPQCACCGENHIEFLSIDHIGGGGSKHRKEIGNTNIYAWLVRNDFPPGFRVLCMNCNFAIGKFGYCPHDKGN